MFYRLILAAMCMTLTSTAFAHGTGQHVLGTVVAIDAKRENGTSMAVDQKVFADSKHGPLACVDCHKDLATLQEFPHPEKLAKVWVITVDCRANDYSRGVAGPGEVKYSGMLIRKTL